MRQLVFSVLVLSLSLLSACSGVTVRDYTQIQPTLIMEQFFDGPLRAAGVVKNFNGRVIRTFTADIKAYWREGVGTLEEDFNFDDGERQRRVWTLQPDGSGGYLGSAGDVVGESLIEVSGNSVFLDYVLRVPYGDSSLDLHIDDRMYLVSPDLIINESVMRKFGIKVGEILLTIYRPSTSAGA
jgi:hypothetical protein